MESSPEIGLDFLVKGSFGNPTRGEDRRLQLKESHSFYNR